MPGRGQVVYIEAPEDTEGPTGFEAEVILVRRGELQAQPLRRLERPGRRTHRQAGCGRTREVSLRPDQQQVLIRGDHRPATPQPGCVPAQQVRGEVLEVVLERG